jgi:glycosyltransferase involved in cell wall biosynthesis
LSSTDQSSSLEVPVPRRTERDVLVPRRILHLVNVVGGRGNGIVNVAVDLAIAQREDGHEVFMAGAAGQYTSLLTEHGVRYLPLEHSGGGGVNAARAVFGLARLIRRHRIEIVHAHNMTGAIVARLASGSSGLGRRSARVVTTVHNSWSPHAELMRVGHRVIAVTAAVRDTMIARGIPAQKIAVVLNGPIGTTRSPDEYGPLPPVTLRRPAVLSVAGMYERKGIRDLIDAAALLRARVPDAVVYLVGDGPDRQVFEAYAKERGVADRVEFLGFRADVLELMRAADVFVLASHAEAGPLVVVEARSVGTPVVATAAEGVSEMLDNGEAGLLVPPRDPAALADALARVLLDQALAAQLREAGLSGCERFHVSRMARETVDVYQELLA